MIDKELSEILDALTRESGESMLPYQELELFGLTPLGKTSIMQNTMPTDGNAEDDEIDYDDEEYSQTDADEEYEFDEDDEEYTLLTRVLRFNNCRKKYFA